MNTVAVISGGFDPIHPGHIDLIEGACLLSSCLIIGLNSDKWLTKKKGSPFMVYDERWAVLNRLTGVHGVWPFDDSDGTAVDLLHKVKEQFPDDEIIFCNGGDRTKDNIPEMSVEGIGFHFGVGGDKVNSSSDILEHWEKSKGWVERDWGRWRVIESWNHVSEARPTVKLKELVVNPQSTLSYQRHNHRSEFWVVQSGRGTFVRGGRMYPVVEGNSFLIQKGEWHQIINGNNQPLVVIETQWGQNCDENDIERR